MGWWWPSNSTSTSGSSSSSTAATASADACPVDHQTRSQWVDAATAAGAQASSSSSSSEQPDSSACPVDHTTRSTWVNAAGSSSGSIPPGHPHIPKALSTERETSSIPRTESANWVYPSPKQFFDALVRKGYVKGSESVGEGASSLAGSHGSGSSTAPSGAGASAAPPPLQVSPASGGQGHVLRSTRTRPREEDMDVIVPIHNAVNERAWTEVMRWERERGLVESRRSGVGEETETLCRCEDVKLVSFKGRPGDLSPKARFKSLIGCVFFLSARISSHTLHVY